MSSINETIDLLIASYCDPELLTTIESALRQADNKERVHLAVCFQDDDLKTLEKLKKIPHCKVIHLWKKEARGSVYARMLCQQMLDDEKYVYQIDSHMRFIKHWDTKLIKNLKSLHDDKAILSSYPLDCSDEVASLPIDDPFFDKPTCGEGFNIIRFKNENSYLVDITPKHFDKDSPLAYEKSPYLGAGNLFTYGKAYKEVLFDPHFVFHGDELPMAIRFYTHGYNIYNPKENYVYHHFVERPKLFYKNCLDQEEKRFQELLNLDGQNKDLGIYGLGTDRTLKEYEKTFGINFKKRIIYMNAEIGEFSNKKYFKKISYIQGKKKDRENQFQKEKTIEVVIIDKFNEYEKCLKSCLKNSCSKNNIKFLIATTSSKESNNDKIKKLIHLQKENYGEALSYLTKELSNSYVLLIDSSVRFAPGWDEYYLQVLDYCGENSALTSWVFQTENENNIYKYENKVKEIINFKNSLPELFFNNHIAMLKRNKPYKTSFISDNFLFCKSSILKNIPVDPSLTFEEHQYLYSIRLWTNGINLYYPVLSYVMRLKDISYLKEGLQHQGIIDALLGIKSLPSKKIVNNYEFGLGNKRPLWTLFNFINVKYDEHQTKLQIYLKY